MSEGLCRKQALFSSRGRKELEGLALDRLADRRRRELLGMLDHLNSSIAELDQEVAQQARQHPAALEVMGKMVSSKTVP